jgi:hypothetical protein
MTEKCRYCSKTTRCSYNICKECLTLNIVDIVTVTKQFKLTKNELVIAQLNKYAGSYSLDDIKKIVCSLPNNDQRKQQFLTYDPKHAEISTINRYTFIQDEINALLVKYDSTYVNRIQPQIDELIKTYSLKINMNEFDCTFQMIGEIEKLIDDMRNYENSMPYKIMKTFSNIRNSIVSFFS